MSDLASIYPATGSERNKWVEARRGDRAPLDPQRPYAYLVEEERSASGEVVPVATIFLTNRECPWRCVMCDLWRNALDRTIPAGAVPSQIEYALSRLPPARQVKLYNSGSFFDPRAVPPVDYKAISRIVRHFDRVIVECHPALVGESSLRFRDLLGGGLEVAMGLETAHPEILAKLNKRMTLEQFASSAQFLRKNSIDLRGFILVQPPFMRPEEALHWAERSLDFAFECGATAASLIPTRGGNGAMETLEANGEFVPPRMQLVEAAASYGLGLRRGRVFVDLWGLSSGPSNCFVCHSQRVERLSHMNMSQRPLPEVFCAACGSAA